jgi:hypothetical protein
MAAEKQGNVAPVGTTPEVDLSQLDSNANSAPDGAETEDFFSALDETVNSVIMEQNQTTASEAQPSSNTQSNEQRPEEAGVDYQNEAENLSKRYSDSSREAKRLNNRLGELEPYVPILDAMRKDPNLVSHVKGYFEGGGVAPSSMKEQLGLTEEFVFDPDEAFANPKSDSSKLMSATIDGIVQRRLTQADASMKQENLRLSDEAGFRNRHEMSEEDWGEFQQFAKSKTLELDDIYYLMNRKGRDQRIAQETNREVSRQIKNVQSTPGSVATSGSTTQDGSVDDKVFDMLLGVDEHWKALTD